MPTETVYSDSSSTEQSSDLEKQQSDDEAQKLPPLRDMPLDGEQTERRLSWLLRMLSSRALPWFLVMFIMAFNISSALFKSQRSGNLWTDTDFAPARGAISRTTVKFVSTLDSVDRRNIYRVFDSKQPDYVGNGTDVDKNWDELTIPELNDVKITAEEARSIGGHPWPNAGEEGQTIEIEVFHSLHCVNMIRKRIYSHNYPEMLRPNARIHVDHCLEALREALMCNGDMTPLPLKWSEVGNRWNPDFAVEHSCRDYGKLRDWLKTRA